MARCDSCGRDKETVEHDGRQLCLMCLSKHGVPEAHLPELSIDKCARVLRNFVKNCSCGIQGPHETAYGFGWAPSISYWIGKRRVHLYEDLGSESSPEPFAVEIADISDDEDRIAQRCHVTSVEQIRDIMSRFLCNHCSIEELSDYQWIRDNLDSDKFIPDPPNRQNPASFAGMVGGHSVPGGPPAALPRSATSTARAAPPKTGGRCILGLVFFCLGTGSLIYAGICWKTYSESAVWERVSATVEDVHMAAHHTTNEWGGRESTTWSVNCRYAYEFNGKSYIGTRVGIVGSSGSYELHWRRFSILYEHKRTGKSFPAFVDPDDPRSSLLFRDVDNSTYVCAVFGLILAGVGVGFMVVGARAQQA